MPTNDLNVRALSRELEQAIQELKVSGQLEDTGVVTRAADGILWIWGLRKLGFGELVEIEISGQKLASALTLSLGEDEVGAVLLDDQADVRAGAKVRLTGRVPQVPVGPELLGRVVDPLGRPLDGLGSIATKHTGPVEKPAPGVIDRMSVHEPLETGTMAIDAMVPIGRGQRELVIGDRKTGKTALCVDAIINQARQKTGVFSIYVAIGQKRSTVAALIERLKNEDAMKNTIVIATSPADPAPLLYLAPYVGAAMGEYFRDKGQHALLVLDDLSKHAVAYRQMSLLLRRPPGREAYPGDIFYLHARLLERASKLTDKLGGGSLTALPIIETQAGDVAAYIPTNVISITDGQIYLENDLFYQGIRPAISTGLSVSRVGGTAQYPGVKGVAGALRLDLAQFHELAAFSQFSSDLDEDTRTRIARGRTMTEVLKQPQYAPYSVADQLIILTAATEGAFDGLDPDEITDAKIDAVHAVKTEEPDLYRLLGKGQKLDDHLKQVIVKLASRHKKAHKATVKTEAAKAADKTEEEDDE